MTVIRSAPVPYCPDCGGQMVLRRPKRKGDFEPFWGCSNYPDCKGTRNIQPDGAPEPDDPLDVPIWD